MVIGQTPASTPAAVCNGGQLDIFQQSVVSGNSYLVPAGGVAITSWSTFAAAGAGQMLEMKVFQTTADPDGFKVVAHDGPHPLDPSRLNTFATNVPVQPGDILGINNVNPSMASNACIVSSDPGDMWRAIGGDLADGQVAEFVSSSADRVNVSAVVGFEPSNRFSFGRLKRNSGNGTAKLAVEVPGPGKLVLAGKGIKGKRRGASAAASKTVAGAGAVKLRIRAKGAKRRKLRATGKARVKARVTFTPDGTATGDVVGDPKTKVKRVKLVKKG